MDNKGQEPQFNFASYISQGPELKPKPRIMATGLIVSSLVGGLLIGLANAKGWYFFILYELILGYLLGLVAIRLAARAEFYRLRKIRLAGLSSIVLMVFSAEYFLYLSELLNGSYTQGSFLDYTGQRMARGFLLAGSIDLSWWGFLLYWLVQVVVAYLLFYLKLFASFWKRITAVIPQEVLAAVVKILNTGGNEKVASNYLAEKGWHNGEDRAVAILASRLLIVLGRMKK